MKFAPPESARPPRAGLLEWSISGWMTPMLIGTLSLAFVFVSVEHGRGNLHKLRNKVIKQPEEPEITTGPGGQNSIRLRRNVAPGGPDPEFLSATLLPGRGMNLWQLTAYLPGHGQVPLLVSTSGDDTFGVLSGIGSDSNGSASTEFGAALLAPWAAQLAGGPAPGVGYLQTQWQGERLLFPASASGSTLSTEGLLLQRGADGVRTTPISDGQSVLASFHAGSFAGSWPSDTEMSVQVDLTGQALELTVTARNTGTVAEPFGVGWHPYFAIPSGDRANATLLLPSNTRISPPDASTGLSNGHTLSVSDTPYDFSRAGGTRLGAQSLDDTYTNLRTAMLADGPTAELRDPAAGYGLRIIPLSGNIKHLRVIAPADKPWVSIGPNMNTSDPFGHEWDQLSSTGMVILQPGDKLQWKVRVEIFALDRSKAPTSDR